MSNRNFADATPRSIDLSLEDQIRVNLNYWFDLCELRGAIVDFPKGPNLDHARAVIEHFEEYLEAKHNRLIAKLANGEKGGGEP